MHINPLCVASIFLIAGCASAAPTEAFDPGADPRIGAEVSKACYSSIGQRGGYRRIGDRDGFLTGSFDEMYLLVFSNGCRAIRFSGSAPVFRDYGDNCRRVGERVETVSTTSGVTGACVIQQIFEWDEDGADAEETDSN